MPHAGYLYNQEYRNGEQNAGNAGNARIPGNVIILTFRGMFQRIPGNVQEGPGECLKRFWGMFEENPGNAHEDSGECLRGFRGMLKKNPRNVRKDSRKYSKRLNAL